MKKCSKCSSVKDKEKFPKRGNRCKACISEVGADYYRKNAERILARQIEYERQRTDIKKVYDAEYRRLNRDERNAQKRDHYHANKVELNAQRSRARRENLSKWKSLEAEYRQKNKERQRANQNARRARKIGSGGRFTAKQIEDLAAAQKHKCANPLCRKSIKSGFNRDHMQPLSRGGSNDIGNIQLLCGPCNRRKYATPYEDWCRETGQLCFLPVN